MRRQERLVGGDDMLAVGDGLQHVGLRGFDATDQFNDDIDVGMINDDLRIVGEIHAIDASRRFACLGQRARRNPADANGPPGAARDLLFVTAQDGPGPTADRAHPEEPDVDGFHCDAMYCLLNAAASSALKAWRRPRAGGDPVTFANDTGFPPSRE